MGKLLSQKGKLRRGELARYARLLEVNVRTLRKWRGQADRCTVMGRPRHAQSTWRAAVVPVARAWRSQGRTAGRPRVEERLDQLGIAVPPTITRALLRELKIRDRSARARRQAEERRGLRVAVRDALWSLDATHLGRDEHGKVEALQVRDVATTASIDPAVVGPAKGEDVLALLKRAKLTRGVLPHVLAMDNGPAGKNQRVCSYLASEGVVVLWNVPHTPEHNPWVESLHGELKAELEARGELPEMGADPSQGPRSLAEAGGSATKSRLRRCVQRVTRLLNERVRTSRGGFTATQLDSLLGRAEDLVSRDRFYEAACAAQKDAVLATDNARARRRAEREAVLCTLEQMGLVTRTRGTRPAACSKTARLS